MRLVYSKFETHNAKTKLQTPKRNVLLQQSRGLPCRAHNDVRYFWRRLLAKVRQLENKSPSQYFAAINMRLNGVFVINKKYCFSSNMPTCSLNRKIINKNI